MAVAVGSLVTYASYALAVLWYVSGHFALGRGRRLRFLAEALVPGGVLGLVLTALGWLLPFRESLARAAAAGAFATLLFGPLALRALRLARRLDQAGA
jgi:hypothetical protein